MLSTITWCALRTLIPFHVAKNLDIRRHEAVTVGTLDAVFPATELFGRRVVLGCSQVEVGSRPLAFENKARVEGGDEETGNDDHDTLESQESALVVGERA